MNELCQSPIKTAYSRQAAELYDQMRFVSPKGKMVHQRELMVVRRALKKLKERDRLLEVGCGTGRILFELLQEGFVVDGADASPEMLAKLRGKLNAHTGCQLWVAPAHQLPLADNCYAFTYAIRLLNQTESPEYALSVVREMLRVTQPGGWVLVEFMNAVRPRWGLGKRPTTRLRPSEVIRKGQEHGGRLVRVDGNFLLGMQALMILPLPLARLISRADGILATFFPRLCSRCYILFQKIT